MLKWWVHTALKPTERWLYVICWNPPRFYVTSKSPLSSLVIHTLKSMSMWIRETKRLCGNLQRSGMLAGPVESNFVFFMISLESEYNCCNGLLLLKLGCWCNLWKNKIKWLAPHCTASRCQDQAWGTGLLTFSLLLPWSNSTELNMSKSSIQNARGHQM